MVSAPRSRDWAAKLGVRDEVSEAALGYADRDRVRAAYRRTRYLDERNTLMQRWAEFVAGSAAPVSSLSQPDLMMQTQLEGQGVDPRSSTNQPRGARKVADSCHVEAVPRESKSRRKRSPERARR